MGIELEDELKENFAEDFLSLYLERGFGTMPKREIDILIFHLLKKHKYIKSNVVFEIANKLMITDTKVNSLLIETSLKYEQGENLNILKRVMEKLKDSKFDYINETSKKIKIELDNPVERRSFENLFKSQNIIVDYSFNRNILSIPLSDFIDVIKHSNDSFEDRFIEEIRSEKEYSKQFEKDTDIRDWIEKIENKKEDIKLIMKAIGVVLLAI